MNTDVEGLNIYVLDSFDTMATLLSKEATFVATKIPEFNKQKLREQLSIASGEDEFVEIFIPLVDEKFDMYNLQDFSDGLGLALPARDPAIHPTYSDIDVRRGEIKPVQIEAGSYALICKSANGCSWENEWWFIKIIPKTIPRIDNFIYEEEFMRPWDGIKRMLFIDKDTSDVPRLNYEQSVDTAYELGYNTAVGRKTKETL